MSDSTRSAFSSIARDAARISVGYTNGAAGRSLVATSDAVDALCRGSGETLDSIGLHIRAPVVPHPEPDPNVVRQLERMYGARGSAFDDRARVDREAHAAYRTAVAMERRRQGWTRAGAEWRARALQDIEGGAQ